MTTAVMSDAQVIALLCAPVGIGDMKPLSVAEWSRLASGIHGSAIGRPAGLPGMSAADLASELALDVETGERVARLLERSGPLAFELERLADRGIWLLTRADDDYPARLRRRLGLGAPPVLFGAGERGILRERGVGVVGSRDADQAALETARAIGDRLAREQAVVVSGGARGVDRASMDAAVSGGGKAVGILGDGLVRLTQARDVRLHVAESRLVLVSMCAPDARFAVWSAMARNKLIYCAADAAIVVAASEGSGGTWAGAVEALEHRWAPVWVWNGTGAPAGNTSLAREGALPLDGLLEASGSLYDALLAGEARQEGGSGALDPEVDDLFALAWPRFELFLSTPRTETELCDRFGLERAQVRSWMTRALEKGFVARKTNPVRFELAGSRPAQPTLFGGRD